MVFQISLLQAIEELIEAELEQIRESPEMLKILLLEGSRGYKQIPADVIAHLYALTFPEAVRRGIQIVNPDYPNEVIASYNTNKEDAVTDLTEIEKSLETYPAPENTSPKKKRKLTLVKK